MKRNNYRLVLIIVLIVAAFVGCNNEVANIDELPVSYNQGVNAFDITDEQKLSGFVDYVFVAKVTEELRTDYRDIDTIETETGLKKVGDPYTIYSVENVKNLKGKLKKNQPFEIHKYGGVSYDKKTLVLMENDSLLEVGKYYVFLGAIDDDGEIVLDNYMSQVALDIVDKNELNNNDIVNKYIESVKNEIKYERNRTKANSDENN